MAYIDVGDGDRVVAPSTAFDGTSRPPCVAEAGVVETAEEAMGRLSGNMGALEREYYNNVDPWWTDEDTAVLSALASAAWGMVAWLREERRRREADPAREASPALREEHVRAMAGSGADPRAVHEAVAGWRDDGIVGDEEAGRLARLCAELGGARPAAAVGGDSGAAEAEEANDCVGQ